MQDLRQRNSKRKSEDNQGRSIQDVLEDSYEGVFYEDDEEEFDDLQDRVEQIVSPIPKKKKKIKRSFDAFRPETGKPKPERKFIIRAVVVDKFTIPRKRVLLTPSMCTINGCPFDIAEKNGFGSWDRVPRAERPFVLEALEEHKEKAHNKSEDYIVEESQLPTRWLGSERGLDKV